MLHDYLISFVEYDVTKRYRLVHYQNYLLIHRYQQQRSLRGWVWTRCTVHHPNHNRLKLIHSHDSHSTVKNIIVNLHFRKEPLSLQYIGKSEGCMSIRVQYLTLQSELNARSLLPENGAQGIKNYMAH